MGRRREEVLTSSIRSSPSNIKSAAIQCILRSTSQRRAIECSLNLIQLDHVTLILHRRQDVKDSKKQTNWKYREYSFFYVVQHTGDRNYILLNQSLMNCSEKINSQ